MSTLPSIYVIPMLCYVMVALELERVALERVILREASPYVLSIRGRSVRYRDRYVIIRD